MWLFGYRLAKVQAARERNRRFVPLKIGKDQPWTGGGCRSNLGKLGSKTAQLGAEDVQISIAGRAISGSSSAPARSMMR
jgi:hypothetical protein